MELFWPILEFLIGSFLFWWAFNAILGEYQEEEDPSWQMQIQIILLLTLGLGLMVLGIIFFVRGI